MSRLIITLIIVFLFCGVSVYSAEKTEVIELTKDNFEEEVLKSDKLVIIDFWAEWCRPCKALSETIDRLIVFNQQCNKDKIKWFKVDVDKDRKFLNTFRPLRGLPVLAFWKDGKEVDRIIGLLPFSKIQDRINRLLKGKKVK